ncbi:MAG: DUF3419 family protein [Cyclobacteriaceae bacterium]|nr:DUF3419 family protein [Cyclobacteriaceae bacterium]
MIYYSHVNEDNTIERDLVFLHQPCTLYCITGSGERLISLLDAPGLSKVVAIDSNPEANFLLELKLKALQALEVEDYLHFVGYYEDSFNRLKVFDQIKTELKKESADYWLVRKGMINKGILYMGYFERYLERLRPITNLFLGKYFQQYVIDQKIETGKFPDFRWSVLLKLLSSKSFYRVTRNTDLAFTSSGCDQQIISMALNKTLLDGSVDNNFMFHLIFKGHLRDMQTDLLPPSLQPKLLKRCKSRLMKEEIDIDYATSDLLELIGKKNYNTYDISFFSISDILSFNDINYLVDITSVLKTNVFKTIHVVFRSFLRNNYPKEVFEEKMAIPIQDLSDKERTNMYKVFHFSI